RNANQHIERNLNIDVFQVVFAGAAKLQPFELQRSTMFRLFDFNFAAQVTSRQRLPAAYQTGEIALIHQLPAEFTCRWPNIEQMIGSAHHLSIMLDDEDGVSDVAKAVQQPNQTIVIARMQSNRRLVEDVKRAHQ